MSVDRDSADDEHAGRPAPCPSVELVIEPRMRDLGGFTVGRVLPFVKRRMVGPFIFFDEMGPADFEPGEGIDVRPHPHIGLATVTYLFDGEIRHKDSLGFDQVIRPGDVNWMIAGRGIVHSERTDEKTRESGQRLHGLQSWIALPENDAETAPSFYHHPKSTLPEIARDGVQMRLIAGEAFGKASPVKTLSRMFYLAADAKPGSVIDLPSPYDERAIYIVDGSVDIDGEKFTARQMPVFAKGAKPTVKALSSTRLMLLGGDTLGPRHIWWNLVAQSQERIEQAKADWSHAAAQGFQSGPFTLPPGEDEFIPLP